MRSAPDSPNSRDVILKALTRLNERATLRVAADELSIIVRVRRQAGDSWRPGTGDVGVGWVCCVCCCSCSSVLKMIPFASAGPGSGQPECTCTEHLLHHRRLGAKASGKEGEPPSRNSRQNPLLCMQQRPWAGAFQHAPQPNASCTPCRSACECLHNCHNPHAQWQRWP